MRNNSVEISSIPFGTDMHPNVWALCASLFRKELLEWDLVYLQEMFVSHVHMKPPGYSNSTVYYIGHGFVLRAFANQMLYEQRKT